MSNKKNIIIMYFVLLTFCWSGILYTNSIKEQSVQSIDQISEFKLKLPPKLSSENNQDLINSIFDSRMLQYEQNGYFTQMYDSSLQATYYALYILNSTGKLNEINQSEIIDFIMAHFDSNSNRFMDILSYRYLDTVFSQIYYPLSSILEVNCYAILSLNLLGRLDLINIQDSILFLWNCFDPTSGGFIGQPYNIGLEEGFKVATLDNTYFAVITLDLLMDDWSLYSMKKDNIIQFINNLQTTSGGFLNDEYSAIDTIYPLIEPNLLSSYYAVKTLEVFGVENTIRIDDFNQFLESLYDPNDYFFHMSLFDYNINYTNIVATSIALELANVTYFEGINREDIITFILENRDPLGYWDQSTTINNHELIDTYQILRSLQNSYNISRLTLEDRDQIGNATQKHSFNGGYAHLSEDYTTMNLIYTLVNSFDLFDRIPDLDIYRLYNLIKDSYKQSYHSSMTDSFAGYLVKNNISDGFRSHPIEFYSSGDKYYTKEITQLRSHKSTYEALDSLKKMFKLDDFAFKFDLLELVEDIIASQFLNNSYYDCFGAFTPLWPYEAARSEYLSTKIFFEYSYYAIRCLELLSNQLALGNLSSLGFDTLALHSYIEKNVIETSTAIYFNPKYTSDTEIILENTYYMLYVLQALEQYTLDSQKIRNYVVTHLDYGNIKNIYYCYKISEILNLTLPFDTGLTQELVQIIYSSQNKEFYLTPAKNISCQEAFLWICEMSRNSEIRIEASYSTSVPLGGNNQISATLSNLILGDFGSYITFRFESAQLGNFLFNKTQYSVYEAFIPIPFSSENFPVIEGILSAYEGFQKKTELPITFSTTYILYYNFQVHKEINSSVVFFELNSSIMANGINYSLTSGKAYTLIHRNNTFIGMRSFSHQNHSEFSTFSTTYSLIENVSYYFETYLEDGFDDQALLVGNATFREASGDDGNDDSDDDNDNQAQEDNFFDIRSALPFTTIFIGVPGIVIIITSKKLHKAKNHSS